MQEIWVDIENYEGLYQVSNYGNVKSLPNPPYKKGKILKPTINSAGYYKVELYKDGKSKIFYVHRLVALTFIPNFDNKPQVNHRNGNKKINDVSNLEWVSESENQKHAVLIGIHASSPMKGKTGAKNPQSKKVLQYDIDGNYLKTWDSIADITRQLAFLQCGISSCINGRSHSSYGYIWKKYTPNFPHKIDSLKSIYRTSRPVQKGVLKRNIAVYQFTKDGRFIKRWTSLYEIKNETYYSIHSIMRNVNGKRKSAYGYIWKEAID